MSIKSKVFAAAATLTLVGGVGSVGGGVARARPLRRAATTASTSSAASSAPTDQPNFVLDVWRQGATVGQPIILFRTSNSDPAEDFTDQLPGH